jgi:hypothetical protein
MARDVAAGSGNQYYACGEMMKTFNLFLFCLLSFFSSAHAEEKELIGEVKYVVGNAKANENELKVGSKVYDEDLLITEKASIVRLLMSDGIAMQIAPNSKLRLMKEDKKMLRVSLSTGAILSRLKKLAQKPETHRYEVSTKHASMGVRGTTFFVKVAKNENTFLCVCEGSVDVMRGGSSLDVTATHHDRAKTISNIGMDSAASMGTDHSDKEIAELDKLLK